MAKKKSEDVVQDAIDINAQLEKLGCKIIEDLSKETAPYSISTGLFSMDLILSASEGFTYGVSEVYGPPNVGKSHFVLSTLIGAQKSGLDVYFVNMERGINNSTIKCFEGKIDATKVHWIEPPHGQAAIDAIELIMRTKKHAFIALDSIPGCITLAQLEATAEENTMAACARLMTAFMPKMKIWSKMNENHLMLINQCRDNLKSPTGGKLTPGGWAVKYNCDWRIELMLNYPKPWIDSRGITVGQKVKAEIAKSRYGRPFQTAVFPLVYGKGFDIGLELVELGLQFGIITKGGAWFEVPGCEKKFQGELDTAEYIRENPTVQETIKTEIRKLFK